MNIISSVACMCDYCISSITYTHEFIVGYHLAPAGEQDCGIFCKSLQLTCSPIIETKNDTKIFIQLGVSCGSDNTEKIWSKEYHPVYHIRGKKCVGFVGVPKTVPCKPKRPILDGNIQRICHCADPGEFSFMSFYYYHIFQFHRIICCWI